MITQRTRVNHGLSLRQTKPFEDFNGLTPSERFLEITRDRYGVCPTFRCHAMTRKANGAVVAKDYLETNVSLCAVVAKIAATSLLALEVDDYSARLICLDRSLRIAGIEALFPEADAVHYPDVEW